MRMRAKDCDEASTRATPPHTAAAGGRSEGDQGRATLPVAAGEMGPACRLVLGPEPSNFSLTNRFHVLLVEDDVCTQRLVQALLVKCNYTGEGWGRGTRALGGRQCSLEPGARASGTRWPGGGHAARRWCARPTSALVSQARLG